jgi:hypothetical protein
MQKILAQATPWTLPADGQNNVFSSIRFSKTIIKPHACLSITHFNIVSPSLPSKNEKKIIHIQQTFCLQRQSFLSLCLSQTQNITAMFHSSWILCAHMTLLLIEIWTDTFALGVHFGIF